MVLIPQTPEQALQRDQLAERANPVRPLSPAAELARLRNAIAKHQDAVLEAGDLGPASKFTSAQRSIMNAKHQADLELWAHLKPPDPPEPETGSPASDSETTGL